MAGAASCKAVRRVEPRATVLHLDDVIGEEPACLPATLLAPALSPPNHLLAPHAILGRHVEGLDGLRGRLDAAGIKRREAKAESGEAAHADSLGMGNVRRVYVQKSSKLA
jgi:hypothetical protein